MLTAILAAGAPSSGRTRRGTWDSGNGRARAARWSGSASRLGRVIGLLAFRRNTRLEGGRPGGPGYVAPAPAEQAPPLAAFLAGFLAGFLISRCGLIRIGR
jgi:hypothetical protein